MPRLNWNKGIQMCMIVDKSLLKWFDFDIWQLFSGAVNSIQKEYEGHDDDDDEIFLEYLNVTRRQ